MQCWKLRAWGAAFVIRRLEKKNEMNDACEHGNMQRDTRDEWPSDVPVGTFDIEPCRIDEYPNATAHLLFVCPNGRRCGVLIGPIAGRPEGEQRLHVWQWDGNVERPTLSPSINCLAEKDGKPAGGCGWHGHITAGVIR